MARLVMLVEGCFFILGSMAVLWWVSPGGNGFQRQVGFDGPALGARDVAMVASGLFALGFVLSGGYALQRFMGGIAGLVTGGAYDHGEGQARSMLLWGLFGYLAAAGLFGSILLVMVERTGAFERFAAPQFLRFVLTWPYHMMAALGVFGLPADIFY